MTISVTALVDIRFLKAGFCFTKSVAQPEVQKLKATILWFSTFAILTFSLIALAFLSFSLIISNKTAVIEYLNVTVLY